jgi:hypothetical protein
MPLGCERLEEREELERWRNLNPVSYGQAPRLSSPPLDAPDLTLWVKKKPDELVNGKYDIRDGWRRKSSQPI